MIGVVEDFHFQSLYEPIRPLVLGFEDNPVEAIDYFTARIEAGQAQAALDHLRAVGERFDPAHPFEYNVLDQRLAEVYEADRRVGRVFGIAAGLAVLIACFGLFGLGPPSRPSAARKRSGCGRCSVQTRALHRRCSSRRSFARLVADRLRRRRAGGLLHHAAAG